MKWFIAVVAVVLLAACSRDENVYTVDELADDGALLTKIINDCRNNPGELHNTPNCLNAEAADGRVRLERIRKSLGG
jgi:hypothetical protein